MSRLLERLDGLVGSELGPTGWLTLEQETVDEFAGATGDRQWIHVDPDRAQRESPYGGTVVHGMLTLSLAPALAIDLLDLAQAGRVINYGLNRVRFPAPLRTGGRVRMRLTLAASERVGEDRRITFDATFESDGSERPVCVAQFVFQVTA